MADYISILDKAVSGLTDNTVENRAHIYGKARAAIERKLRAMDPLPPEAAIAKQLGQLEDAIDEVENRYHVAEIDIEAAFNKAFSIPDAAAASEINANDGADIAASEETAQPEMEPVAAAIEEPAPVIVPKGFIDDPILIDGIGEKTARLLAEQGVTTISQIAAMSDAQLAFVTATIGYPGFELTQEWRQQSLDMLSGKAPRGKTNQDRLAKMLEAAAASGMPESDLPDTVEQIEFSPSERPEFHQTPVADTSEWKDSLPRESIDEPQPQAPETPTLPTSPVAPTISSVPQTGVSPSTSNSDFEIDAALVKPHPDELLEDRAGSGLTDAPVASFDDLIRNIEKLNKQQGGPEGEDRFADETESLPETMPQDLSLPHSENGAPPFVSELDNDPLKGDKDELYLDQRGVEVPSSGGGKVLGGLLAILLLGGVAGAGYYYRDIVMKTANDGIVAVRELINGDGQTSQDNSAKPVAPEAQQTNGNQVGTEPGSEAEDNKDDARLGTGENGATEPIEPAPKPVRTITVPVEQPAEKLPEEIVPPATVEVQEETPAAGAEQPATPDAPTAAEPSASETPVTETPAPEAQAPVAENTTGEQSQVAEQPGAINGEKTYLYEEASGTNGANRDEGSISWSLANESPEEGAQPEPVIKGMMEIPARGLTLNMTIKRNLDAGLPASHIIELVFSAPAEFTGGNIDGVSRFVLKSTEQARGESLVGVPARIDTGYFLIALNNLEQAQRTNLNLLENSDWIDIPVSYVTGRRALLTFEKGATGNAVFKEALADWKNR